MDLILEQFPIVFKSLNIGFLQTLKLFFVTLLGAVPLGLVIAFGSMSRFKPLSYLTKIGLTSQKRASQIGSASNCILQLPAVSPERYFVTMS